MPPFHGMEGGEERQSEILWLKYSSSPLTSPPAVRLLQGWLWLWTVLGGCGGASPAQPPREGGTLRGTCEPKAVPSAGVQGDCSSWEASGWERLVGLLLKLINRCGAL